MDEAKRKTLESLGWTPEMLNALNQTPEHKAVDRMFQDRAEKALAAAGCTALEFLAANPAVSTEQLARRLNRGASPIGITMVAYHEAARQGIVRQVAKDMLIREILGEFPNGWTAKGDVHPLVKIGRWHSEVTDYGGSAKHGQSAERILRSLAIENPPQEGWKPQFPNDPLIDELFKVHWPLERDTH
jgi:hypothetical protein